MRASGVQVGLVRGIALLATGLLAGAFAYGTINVVPTFSAVPLEVRLTFHAALMRMNAPVMQTLMAVAGLGSLAFALSVRGSGRALGLTATASTLATLVITRFGNVPINIQIKAWAAGSPPADYAQILDQWETFNLWRTTAAIAAFLLVLVGVLIQSEPGGLSGVTIGEPAGAGGTTRAAAT